MVKSQPKIQESLDNRSDWNREFVLWMADSERGFVLSMDNSDRRTEVMLELNAVRKTAISILSHSPDPIVRFRLLRDVLRLPENDSDLTQARSDVGQSRWVKELRHEHWTDGSWGRLHGKDYGAKQKIGTTEFGVQRALALGLDADHPILKGASHYLAGILKGTILCRDRPEINDRWPTGLQLIAAATLAQIQPDHPLLDDVWNLWLTIVHKTFASGAYDPEAEIRVHQELTGASVKNSYLVIDNKYTLILLSSRPDALPFNLEAMLLNWIWHKEDGIGYLRARLARPPHYLKKGQIECWVTSLELLSRFSGWRILAHDAIQWLWNKRTDEELWDLGPRTTYSAALPLSENWRKKLSRQFDWTTRMLGLLHCYYADSGSGNPDGRSNLSSS